MFVLAFQPRAQLKTSFFHGAKSRILVALHYHRKAHRPPEPAILPRHCHRHGLIRTGFFQEQR